MRKTQLKNQLAEQERLERIAKANLKRADVNLEMAQTAQRRAAVVLGVIEGRIKHIREMAEKEGIDLND